MTKKEKLALIALVAILVGYGIYQTAYGMTNSTGYFAGQKQGDKDWSHIKLHVCPGNIGYCPARCPPGHSQDYCLAYTFGYRDEILHNAEG